MLIFDEKGIAIGLSSMLDLQKRVMVAPITFIRKSVVASAEAFQTSVRPYQKTTTDMVDAIRSHVSADRGEVTIEGRGAKKINWIRFGTKPHIIRAKFKKALYFKGLFRKQVLHPGAPARPILALGYRLTQQILEREAQNLAL